jgi:leader peptidase (prepilin peptidase)/N-methyltransferase
MLSVAESAFSAVFVSSMLWAFGALYQKIRHKEGLGLGDVKMVGMMGAFFGLQGALFTTIIGSVLGSVVGIIYIYAARKEAASYELPFGSFLAFAAIVAAFGTNAFMH